MRGLPAAPPAAPPAPATPNISVGPTWEGDFKPLKTELDPF